MYIVIYCGYNTDNTGRQELCVLCIIRILRVQYPMCILVYPILFRSSRICLSSIVSQRIPTYPDVSRRIALHMTEYS